MAISYFARSWLLLIPLVPSMIVSVFNLYHLLASRTLRSALNNHVIILLLACGLIQQSTDIVWRIYLYRTGTVLSSTPQFCYAWTYISVVCLAWIFCIMAWASIERHILIFHAHWFGTKRKRVLFHYLPLGVCVLWPMVFFGVVYLALPCGFPLDYRSETCGVVVCIFLYPRLMLADSFVSAIVPSFIVIIFSTALLIRVVYYRCRAGQRIEWRNYKKMAVQLLWISMLYLFLSLPPMVLYAVYAVGLSWTVGMDYFIDSFFFMFWIILFTPFASVISLPEARAKCTRVFFFWRGRNVVRPEMLTMTRMRAAQAVTVLPKVAC